MSRPTRCEAAFSTPYGDRRCDLIAGHGGFHVRNDACGRPEYHWASADADIDWTNRECTRCGDDVWQARISERGLCEGCEVDDGRLRERLSGVVETLRAEATRLRNEGIDLQRDKGADALVHIAGAQLCASSNRLLRLSCELEAGQ